MKKNLLFTAIAFSVILAASPLAFAVSTSGGGDFNYIPMDIYTLASTQTVTSSPNFNPLTFCASAGLVCYSPQFIRSAYDFPSNLDGAGQTIVIVDAYGSPTIVSDLNLFDTSFNIPPPPSFTIICPPGGCPTPSYSSKNPLGPFGWSIETSLDVEYAHAMAPGANIVLDVAASPAGNAINVAESTVIPMFPGAIMSQSFGIPEYLIHNNNAQVLQAEQNYRTAAADGWTVFASAGDSGATNGIATPNANFPASDPLVTAVGGTMGDPYPAGLAAGSCSASGGCTPSGYGGEQVWNEPSFGAASGGAESLLFSTPSFQSGLGLTSRATPDVSYNAAVNGGVLVVWSACPACIGATGPVFFIVGGTSAGSPQWAAIAALADQAAGHPLGYLNKVIYAIGKDTNTYAASFHDITVGNNQLVGTPFGYKAGPGWDDASGWGTPNVANLIPNLVSPPS
ncbi:MAG: S53 family peptidase [Nitrososphaerota archaeon]|nr:S53 family peptidase [Nitrososphaerota archaeon]MDG7026228.1 S53 family peptidase [Nitrososphaerota archaeon]